MFQTNESSLKYKLQGVGKFTEANKRATGCGAHDVDHRCILDVKPWEWNRT